MHSEATSFEFDLLAICSLYGPASDVNRADECFMPPPIIYTGPETLCFRVVRLCVRAYIHTYVRVSVHARPSGSISCRIGVDF